MKDYSKRDYTDLEGKEIRWIQNDGKEYIGLVVGIDRNVGITIVNKEDKNDYLTCLNGPMSPNKGYCGNEKGYNSIFFSMVGMIRKGVCHSLRSTVVENLILYDGRNAQHGHMFSCPFGV